MTKKINISIETDDMDQTVDELSRLLQLAGYGKFIYSPDSDYDQECDTCIDSFEEEAEFDYSKREKPFPYSIGAYDFKGRAGMPIRMTGNYADNAMTLESISKDDILTTFERNKIDTDRDEAIVRTADELGITGEEVIDALKPKTFKQYIKHKVDHLDETKWNNSVLYLQPTPDMNTFYELKDNPLFVEEFKENMTYVMILELNDSNRITKHLFVIIPDVNALKYKEGDQILISNSKKDVPVNATIITMFNNEAYTDQNTQTQVLNKLKQNYVYPNRRYVVRIYKYSR